MKTRYFRYAMLLTVLGAVIYLALGYGRRSFEAYCPFGGVESLWGLVRHGQFSCALGPLNLSLFIAVVVLALLAKKAFCGWACPVGFMGEVAGRLAGWAWKGRPRVNRKVNGWLKLLRYLGLGVVLYFTYNTGDLVLRGFDPFYLVFSGFGHGAVGTASFVFMAVFLTGSLFIPMFFCRYLCPLGACLDPFSRLGLVKISRNEVACTACDRCSNACPHDLAPNEAAILRHRDCTNCLECVDACPEKDVLQLKLTL